MKWLGNNLTHPIIKTNWLQFSLRNNNTTKDSVNKGQDALVNVQFPFSHTTTTTTTHMTITTIQRKSKSIITECIWATWKTELNQMHKLNPFIWRITGVLNTICCKALCTDHSYYSSLSLTDHTLKPIALLQHNTQEM